MSYAACGGRSWYRRGATLALAACCLLAGTHSTRAEGWWILDGQSWRWAGAENERLYSVSVFGGEGTERDLSETLTNLFDFQGSTDRMVAVAGARRIAWFRDQFSIDAELSYALHYNRERYHEFGGAVYVRWHKFPWEDYVATTFAVGIGPSYTTIYPELEVQSNEDDRSKILNQFNLELTLALAQYPQLALLTRLRHRSGMFGAINGVSDASNFLTVGLRYEF